ncbi:MAG TPA: hypothetical protein VHR66_18745 [Gemmataceae bacterium]|jgi:hypothetical protein|nr:hypothetical protein [Gemmataceae bacterium]
MADSFDPQEAASPRLCVRCLEYNDPLRSFKLDTPPDKLRAWVTHRGGEDVPLD